MEYAFKNNYFDEGSTIKQLSQEELKKLRMTYGHRISLIH